MRTALLVFAFCLLTASTTYATNTEPDTDKLLETERLAAERLFWESVEDSQAPQDLQAYLDAYPQGHYAPLARNRLDRLSEIKSQAASPGPEGLMVDCLLALGLSAVREVDDAQESAEALALIASAQAKMGNITAALETAWEIEIEKVGNRARALADVASAQAKAGDPAAAKTFTDALKAAKGIDNAWALAHIAGVQAEARDITGALETARGIDDALWHAMALAHIAVVQAGARDITGALETARGINDVGRRTRTLAHIAGVQAEAGDPAAAETFAAVLETAGKIEVENEWFREVVALVAIADAQVKARDITGALETARGINDAWNRAKALAHIANVQAETGNHGAARETWAEALQTARGIVDAGERWEAIAAIAAAQTEAGDHGAASETWTQVLLNVKEIPPFVRPLLLAIVAHDLAATESRRR